MSVSMEQTITLAAVPLDARNNPTMVDGPCSWTLKGVDAAGAPAEVGRLTVSDDGRSATLLPLMVGTATVLVTADADVSDQTKQITGTLDIVITPSMATSIRIDITEVK